MKNYIKRNRFTFLAVGVVFILYLVLYASLQNKADDTHFQQIYKQLGGLIPWLKKYAQTWSGRILPHAVMMELMQLNPVFFRLAGAAMSTLLVITVYRFCLMDGPSPIQIGLRERILFIVILLLVMLAIPFAVQNDAVYWKAATVLYVWGMAAALGPMTLYVNVLHGRPVSAAESVIAAIGALYAGNFEQTAILMVCFITVLLALALIQRQKIPAGAFVTLGVGLLSTAVSLTMPGNQLRYQWEILAQMPWYASISGADKFFYSINYAFIYIYNNFAPLVLAIAVLTACLIFHRKNGVGTKLLSLIPVVYYALVWLYEMAVKIYEELTLPLSYNKWLLDFYSFNTEKIELTYGQWSSTAAGVACIILLILLICFNIGEHRRVVPALLLSAAFCEIFMMGYSPTVLASSYRIGYISGILLIMVAAAEFYQALKALVPIRPEMEPEAASDQILE